MYLDMKADLPRQTHHRQHHNVHGSSYQAFWFIAVEENAKKMQNQHFNIYDAHGLCLMVAISACVCVCACVCIGNQEYHLPQQIFPSGRWSLCTMITDMICACTEHCCTWLICCTTCLYRDSFVCFCRIITRWVAGRQAGEQVHWCRKRWWFFKAQVLSLTPLTSCSFGMHFLLDGGCMLCLFRETTILHCCHVLSISVFIRPFVAMGPRMLFLSAPLRRESFSS